MRPRNGKADQEAVDTLLAYLSNLKTYCEPALAETLNERIKDGEITDYYRAEFKERAKLEPESTLRTAARATTVIGKILSGISTSYEISDRYMAWIVRLGQIFWGLVEVAVPRSLPNLIFRHWLKVIYAFEVLAILGGMIFAKQQVSRFHERENVSSAIPGGRHRRGVDYAHCDWRSEGGVVVVWLHRPRPTGTRMAPRKRKQCFCVAWQVPSRESGWHFKRQRSTLSGNRISVRSLVARQVWHAGTRPCESVRA